MLTLWWEDSFEFDERVLVTAEELDPYVADYVRANRARQLRRTHITGRLAALRRWLLSRRPRQAGS